MRNAARPSSAPPGSAAIPASGWGVPAAIRRGVSMEDCVASQPKEIEGDAA